MDNTIPTQAATTGSQLRRDGLTEQQDADKKRPSAKTVTHQTPEQGTTCLYLCNPTSKVRPGPSERPVNPPVPRADPGQRNGVVCCLSVRVCVCHQTNPTFTPPHQVKYISSEDMSVIMTSGCGTTRRGGGCVPFVATTCSQFLQLVSQSSTSPNLPRTLSRVASFPPTHMKLLSYCYFLARRVYGRNGHVYPLLVRWGERSPGS